MFLKHFNNFNNSFAFFVVVLFLILNLDFNRNLLLIKRDLPRLDKNERTNTIKRSSWTLALY